LARTSPPCLRVRYSIVHSTTAGRLSMPVQISPDVPK